MQIKDQRGGYATSSIVVVKPSRESDTHDESMMMMKDHEEYNNNEFIDQEGSTANLWINDEEYDEDEDDECDDDDDDDEDNEEYENDEPLKTIKSICLDRSPQSTSKNVNRDKSGNFKTVLNYNLNPPSNSGGVYIGGTASSSASSSSSRNGSSNNPAKPMTGATKSIAKSSTSNQANFASRDSASSSHSSSRTPSPNFKVANFKRNSAGVVIDYSDNPTAKSTASMKYSKLMSPSDTAASSSSRSGANTNSSKYVTSMMNISPAFNSMVSKIPYSETTGQGNHGQASNNNTSNGSNMMSSPLKNNQLTHHFQK